MSSGDLRITISDSRFDELQREFDLYKYGVKEALRDATQDTLRDLNGILGDMIARRLNLQAEVLKERITLHYSYKSGNGFVWFGLNDISLASLGAVQSPDGVRAGPVFRRGAFIVPKLNDQVFRRAPGSRSKLVKQSLSIVKESKDVIEREIFPNVVAFFKKNLRARLEASSAKRRRR